eukprot:9249-Heterococcus_DN1.PRE.1
MKDKRFLSWNFNVFELETKSNGHSLWFAAMTVFAHYNFGGAFDVPLERLSAMLLHIERSYCFNPDKSVLENFHASESFKVMLDPKFAILEHWGNEDLRYSPRDSSSFRLTFIKCVLATDLAHSFEYTSKFLRASDHVKRCCQRCNSNLVTVAADSVTDITVATAADVGVSALVTLQHTSDNQTLLVQMILK